MAIENSATKLIDISTKKYPNTFAIVDICDYERLNCYKWSFTGTKVIRVSPDVEAAKELHREFANTNHCNDRK